MLFDSYEFLLLFPAVLLLFFALPHARFRVWWLTAASLFFYGWWNPYYLPLLLGSIGGNFAVAKFIHASTQPWKKKSLLAVGIIGNLSLLAYFKYAGFFIHSLATVTGMRLATIETLLPLAISFFTFQQIGWLVEGYRQGRDVDRFDHYAFFVCFFPQLIAGPIVRHSEIMPQLSGMRPTARNWTAGIVLVTLGLAKKRLIADSLIPSVSGLFDAAHSGAHVAAPDAWLGTLAYTLQLYFDFSGYSDIAIGLGAFFGIVLPVNFASPYRATSIVDFWRRWHISLSRFLRDYLYIPLGGNRGSGLRQATTLMTVMLLGGLWHGAGWTFVFWGGLHGVYLAINHLWRKLPQWPGSNHIPVPIKSFLGWALTFLAVMLGWVFFRAASFTAAQHIVASMAGLSGGGLELFHVPDEHLPLIVVAALLAWFAPNSQQIQASIQWLPGEERERPRTPLGWLAGFQPEWRWAVWLAMLLICSIMQFSSVTEFIYFNF